MSTHAQREAAMAIEKHGTQVKAAKALGISRSALRDRLSGLQDSDPVWTPTSKTTLRKYEYEESGDVVLEWTRIHPEARELQNFAETLEKSVAGKGKVPKRRERKTDQDDLLLEVAISDPHIGMFADASETGSKSYDTGKAVELILSAVDNITSRVRPAETLLVFNGDILHCDNRSNVTEKSRNPLDVDGRYASNVDAAIEAITGSVALCAQVSKVVNVLVVPGNHDYHSAIILARVIHAYYRECPNVNVIVNKRPRHVFQWGNCLIGHAHGDGVKAPDWAKVIPTEFPMEWAGSRYRYMHLGHIHKNKNIAPVEVDEQIGLVVEYLKALCPPDQWHVDSGYVGTIRGADGFLYHKELGLDTRWSFNT